MLCTWVKSSALLEVRMPLVPGPVTLTLSLSSVP